MTKISQPGIYDMPEAEYHADPCITPSLSSGIASKIIDTTLAEAKFNHPRLNPLLEMDDPSETGYDLGSVLHKLVLGVGPEVEVIDAPTWQTKAAKEARVAAFAAHKQPILIHNYEKAEVMVARLFEQLPNDPDNADAFNPATGKGEQTAIAVLPSPSGDVMCRARCDWLARPTPDSAIIYDYKSWQMGCDPEDFIKYLFREGRDIQDPFYTLVTAAALGIDPQKIEFRFVVQSAKEPHLISVVQMDDQARGFAFERTRYAIEKWGHAMQSGQWPGYRPRTHFVAAPPYEFTKWAEKLAAEEFADQLDERASENEGN